MDKKILEIIKLSNKPLKVGDIEKKTGIDRNTIQKIVNQLSIEGIIEMDKCYNKILGLREKNNG